MAKNSSKSKGLSANAQWALIIGTIVAAVGGLIFVQVRDTLDPGGTGVISATAWDLPALDPALDEDGDGRVRLADFTGTPTVVNFFASWCIACETELPDFRDTARELDGKVDFVFVNSNETGGWRGMAEDADVLEFPLAKDIEGTRRNGLYRSLRGTGGMPITAFYDANGNLVDVAFTAFNAASLRGRLTALGLT